MLTMQSPLLRRPLSIGTIRMLEKKIEQYLVKRVRQLGGEIRKVRWVGRRGAPDRLVMMPDQTIWVELKRPKGKAERHQLREHERMRRVGQRVEIIDSIEKVESLLS